MTLFFVLVAVSLANLPSKLFDCPELWTHYFHMPQWPFSYFQDAVGQPYSLCLALVLTGRREGRDSGNGLSEILAPAWKDPPSPSLTLSTFFLAPKPP